VATVKKKNVTTWRKAVKDILCAAGIKKALLAQELGVSHVVVVRFLNGGRSGRTPSPDSALRIDRTVARLAGHAGVELYLNLEAAACGLLQEEHFGGEALVNGVRQCLGWYARFFKPGAIERIHEFINALGEPEKRKCVLGLNRALRGVVVSELLPSSKPAGFQAIYDVLKASGIELEEVVSERCTAQLEFERFVQTVQHELAEQNRRTPARERLAATQRILESLNPYVLAALEVSTDSTAEGILREVRITENGKQVSHFYGDSRAAWTSFMPQDGTKFNPAPAPTRKARRD
jgi:hypothetical protein